MADPNLPIHSTRLPQITPGSALSIREDVAFSDAQGKERPRLRKATDKALSRLQEILPRMLQPREVVRHLGQRETIPLLLLNSTGAVSASGGMVSLCPKCLATLMPNTYRCPQCGQVFKDEKTLRRFLLIPGGEFFYVGQHSIGALHGLVQAGWLLAVLAVAAGLIFGRRPANLLSVVIPSAGVALIFMVHKLAGFFPCRQLVREFIPLK
ncbi:MAG: hypothetical protein DMG32_07680 [Acidobacteria bacterium]|nr:MAG: hypothetical protein DMG32_07680 [Acidobacteriota bacterium]